MFGKKDVSDKELSKTVHRRLDRAGAGSQSRVKALVQRGTVTLTGEIQYEKQRTPIVKAVSNIAGVRQVIDQLRSPPKTKFRPA